MRVVRELAAIEATGEALLQLHAAAFALDGATIAIPGAKGAGKTTLLCHALEIPGASFVANDRVLLHAGGRVHGSGLPTIIRLRGDAPVLFPRLMSRLRRYHHARTLREARLDSGEALAGVSPAQLCAAAEVTPTAGAELRAIVFPQVGGSTRPHAIRRLPAAETAERLAACLFHAEAPAELAQVWGARRPATSWTPRLLTQRCRDLSRTVPGYLWDMPRLARSSPEIVETLAQLARCPERFA
jgi:hypothetical protein